MLPSDRYYQLCFSLIAKLSQHLPLRDLSFEEALVAFEQGLQLERGVRESCHRAFVAAKQSGASVDNYAQEMRAAFGKRPHVLVKALLVLLQLAVVERKIAEESDRLLEMVARIFGLSQSEYRQLRGHFISGEPMVTAREMNTNPAGLEEELLNTLGCRRGASNFEIRRAYRQLALREHPDIYASLNLTSEVRRELTLRFQRIQAAYQQLKSLRQMN